MGKTYKIILLAVIIALRFTAAAQVVGRVVDNTDGNPLPGVGVYWEGTSNGVVSDSDGRFSLRRHEKSHRLIVAFTGYSNDTVIVHNDTSLRISLHRRTKQLNKIAVRGRRKTSFYKMTSIEQTEVITTEGLRGLACCNLGESFENSATVDVGYSDAVSGSKQIQLLGLTGVYSQMLLENTPFLHGLSAPFGLGYVPGQWMESISVSKGVATVKNGYEAITGTINLEYEKPNKGDRLSFNLYGNSDLKTEATAKINHRFNDRLATGFLLYGVNGSMRSDHLGHDGFMDYPLQRQINVANRWHYDNGKGFVSQSLVNYIHDERLGGDMRFEREMRGNDSVYGFGGTTDRLHFLTKNGWMISNTASIGTQVAGTWFSQDAFYGLSEYRGEEKELYVNILVNSEVSGGHIVDYGVSFRYTDISENLDHMPDKLLPVTDYLFPYKEVVPGLFGQYTFRYGDDFNATAGLRYDYNSHYSKHLLTPRLHFRWHLGSQYVLRGSAGVGYRTPNIIAENFGLLASGRSFHFDSSFNMEHAWNTGVNLTKKFKLSGDRELDITLDYYHTEFWDQVVADLVSIPGEAWFVNLNGRSFSNVVQLDVNYEPVEGLSISLAGKLNDVRCTYNGTLMNKPFTSKWKGLLVLSYKTKFEKWRFDLTTQLNGPQTLPSVYGTTYYVSDPSIPTFQSDPYIYMLGQITRKFKRFELYAGVENITGYTQDIPVFGADSPFSALFDASVVYAPLMGRLFYAGLRFNLL